MSDHHSRCGECGGVRPAQNTAEYTRERLLLIAEVGFCACRVSAAEDAGRAPAGPARARVEAAEVRAAEAPAAEPKAEPRAIAPLPAGSRAAR
ncbi:hypothetical protein HS041_15905 [Planomonospora sp. ID67723]|uniref:hypothetical protein n=1 Tax=Planomonospora sp. ID67723 TaxID=2738134 RepID=UPI0018C3E8EC|nr:hypothetical protein [Planomonospora sp. ID67723]MBG0829253.1 hypothetical protein [Planomonospora sp. ID67723]